MSDLNRQDFCAAMQVSDSTVARWLREGLPYTPVGIRAKRFNLDECKRWLRARECQTGSTKKDDDTLKSRSIADVFTDASRRVHLRVMPGGLKPKSA